MKHQAGVIFAVCAIVVTSSTAIGETQKFQGSITGTVTPTTIDSHPDGHPASLTFSRAGKFIVQELAENDRAGEESCKLSDGKGEGKRVVGQPIGGPGIFGFQVWHHENGSSLWIHATRSETCMGESLSHTSREGVIIGGTGDFEGATGTLTQRSDIHLLWGGPQAFQPYGSAPTYIGYFVSTAGEYELIVETP